MIDSRTVRDALPFAVADVVLGGDCGAEFEDVADIYCGRLAEALKRYIRRERAAWRKDSAAFARSPDVEPDAAGFLAWMLWRSRRSFEGASSSERRSAVMAYHCRGCEETFDDTDFHCGRCGFRTEVCYRCNDDVGHCEWCESARKPNSASVAETPCVH